MSPLNITVLHKFLYEVTSFIEVKALLTEKVKNNFYVEKHIFEKVGKCPLNIACMLICMLV